MILIMESILEIVLTGWDPQKRKGVNALVHPDYGFVNNLTFPTDRLIQMEVVVAGGPFV